MEAERPRDDGGREIRLEGLGLFAFGALALIVVVAAFLLGRWTAPEAAPAGARSAGVADSSELERAPDQGGGHFDTVRGSGQAEPQREIAGRASGSKTGPGAAPPASPSSAPPAATPPTTVATPGPWVVQVFAGRDREAAEALVRGLTVRGYPVRIDSSRDGSDVLFKVRVGGYTTQADASAAAERLRKEGDTGAWVTRTQ